MEPCGKLKAEGFKHLLSGKGTFMIARKPNDTFSVWKAKHLVYEKGLKPRGS